MALWKYTVSTETCKEAIELAQIKKGKGRGGAIEKSGWSYVNGAVSRCLILYEQGLTQ